MKNDNLIKDLIDKMFEIAGHDVRYEDVLYKDEWYNKWTMTEDQSREWITWGTEYIRKKLRTTKVMARKKMDWTNLMWGLRVATEKVN